MNVVNFEQGKCARVRSLLDLYLSNELLVETTHELLAHLAGCTDCAKELESRQQLKARLKSAVIEQPVPAGLEAEIKKSLRRRPYDNWGRWGSVVAAAIALIVATLW